MSPDIILGAFIVLIAFIGLLVQMPEPETYGPPDSCGCGGKFCPNSDPDPAECEF